VSGTERHSIEGLHGTEQFGFEGAELFYSENKNEKEDHRRAHRFARDFRNGEEVD